MNGVQSPNLHEGHRQRVKSKFLKYGIESLDDYQVLEAMLFYAVPKKDTNELAHTLVNRFGSLAGVLEAEYDELIKVNGVGENIGSMLKLFGMVSMRYAQSSFSYENRTLLDDTKKMLEYCKTLFLGEKRELVYLLALDTEMLLVGKEVISQGSVDSVEVTPRRAAEFAFKSNSNNIVITHNHPQGTSLPSRADVKTTIHFREVLKSMDIELIDHIIVGRDGAISFRNSSYTTEIW